MLESSEDAKMASKNIEPNPNGNLSLHIRILYCLSFVIIVGVSVATWACLSEVDKLRKDFTGQVLRRGVAEFGDVPRVNVNDVRETFTEGRVTSEEEEEVVPEEEQLLRVKRDVSPIDEEIRRKQQGQPSYYHHGEGSGMSDDWVWLTSYARIPVSPLFCLLSFQIISKTLRVFFLPFPLFFSPKIPFLFYEFKCFPLI